MPDTDGKWQKGDTVIKDKNKCINIFIAFQHTCNASILF